MIILSCQNIRKHYGPEPVLDGVTFDVRPTDRIALVGPNGTGKTTLLRILAGLDDPDGGQLQTHGSARVGYLDQQPQFAAGRTVWEEAAEALGELVAMGQQAEQLAQQLSLAEGDDERHRIGRQFDRLQHELQRRDGYHLDHKIERVLMGLGFQPDSFQQPVNQLSGGQQNRLLLGKLLLEDPDLLLLDEPSNHLDLEATRWLEDYLVDTNQTLIVVSHDRYFLNRITSRTLELFQGTVEDYPGNFDAYQRQKSERLEVQRRTYERQQAEIAKMEDFVRRHHYGQKHAQAEDRRKKLERIERVSAPREIRKPPMRFPEPSRSGDIVIRAEKLGKAFDQPLFENLSLDILRGEKWGILGPNGCGKTTLLRCLLGQEPADAGRVVHGTGVKCGYFDQLLRCLDAEAMVVDAIRPGHKEFLEGDRRSMLARFGITGDMVFQPIDSLSGGERNRAALAYLAALDANLLILDEPTNHLDLWARESLENALREFPGTVVLVSHDRFFLNRVVDHLLVMGRSQFQVIEGNYDTYQHLANQGVAEPEASNTAKKSVPAAESKQRERPRPVRRKRKFPYRKVAELEADIAACEMRIEELHQALLSPEVLRQGERVKQAKQELETQQENLTVLYEHWEEASELN
jgi:ATP-binding cassette subfamily F protein 3